MHKLLQYEISLVTVVVVTSGFWLLAFFSL